MFQFILSPWRQKHSISLFHSSSCSNHLQVDFSTSRKTHLKLSVLFNLISCFWIPSCCSLEKFCKGLPYTYYKNRHYLFIPTVFYSIFPTCQSTAYQQNSPSLQPICKRALTELPCSNKSESHSLGNATTKQTRDILLVFLWGPSSLWSDGSRKNTKFLSQGVFPHQPQTHLR